MIHVTVIRGFCIVALCSVIGSASASAAQQPQASDAQILHLLNRISYGPAPGDIENVRRVGIGAYIEQQLNPNSLQPPADLESRLAALPTVNAPMNALAQQYALPPNFQNLPEDERKELQKRQNTIIDELVQAKFLRAALSPAQLQEVMVDFWFNHFNVFAEKGLDKLTISSYERDAIRPYAMGKFSDLLKATARHPAMLFYLDNWLNTDPNSVVGQNAAAHNKKIGINENYAREIMELHTLGVNGGYMQADVTSLAHILTGWGLGEGRDQADRTVFYFDPRRHDFADQRWMNMTIRAAGPEEINTVLDVLAHHPSTAQHISYELAQYFVADDPPKSLVDALAATFRATGGDMTEILRTLFHSPEFWDTQYTQQKFKPPFRYVVSTMRASGVEPPQDTHMLQGIVGQMGEPLYRCLTPNGYAATNDQWLNSDALLKRIDFSKKLAGFLNINTAQTVTQSLGNIWSARTLQTIADAQPKLNTALILSSPEFVYY
jgi:uncharacterized protein (DUF1800 family)